KILDHTVTPMGSRLLRRWLLFPLQNIQLMEERYQSTEYFLLHRDLHLSLIQILKQCGDPERLVARLPLRKISPREVLQLAKTLRCVQEIKDALNAVSDSWLLRMAEQLNPCTSIQQHIENTLIDQLPAVSTKGGLIRDGIHEELDEYRKLARSGKEYLIEIQQRESERTGIPSLKIAYNSVFGYYLEVTNAHKNKVPDDWMRKQTLTNAERYITPELKEYEQKISGAEEKILALETRIYEALLVELQEFIAPIQLNASVLAQLDGIACFATNAQKNNYCKPEIEPDGAFQIESGRHPVIEQHLPVGETYVSNDVLLNKEEQQIIILTGPNMSGKSALLRQTVLICLMAHAGSFVPARKARIPLTDKIFTRVGASDNLSGGESTFMVEMNETASIMNNMSARSLIVLDEIGRGTSTFDGISIAWSIAEYLHEHPFQPLTLFATHYHELNELEQKFPRIRNYHITHKEQGNKIVFLRKLALGGSTHSFGLHVARMAGMPSALVERAHDMLQLLEEKNHSEQPLKPLKHLPVKNYQLNIFDGLAEDLQRIKEILEGVDINSLTPVEALLKLNELQALVKSHGSV
ncbi:MAG TPA: DNA mismatch repair protein MutS, partial [Chitinophagaceae bacterium]|nr:DNA mismatch repair protein MutS [Chitinophagaceae bacterium]